LGEKQHEQWMERALFFAGLSQRLNEVPVGALVVLDGQIVGEGFNRRELKTSVLEHAELNAIKAASKNLGRWRLKGATVYSTLEPCIMCAGALIHARIDCLVYGAADPKFGAIESLYSLNKDTRLNHQFTAVSGVLADKSAELLRDFFQSLRKRGAFDSLLSPTI
jgi:tRNA(adenine34) deaminase